MPSTESHVSVGLVYAVVVDRAKFEGLASPDELTAAFAAVAS